MTRLKISKLRVIIVLSIVALLLIAADVVAVLIKNKYMSEYENVNSEYKEHLLEEKIEADNNNADDERRGVSRDVPQDIQDKMIGVSMPESGGISFSKLKYLTVPYYDFKGKVRVGHMIVNEDISEEVLDIFAELFDIRYPIESMELPENFADKITNVLPSVDLASKGNNNTSCFFDAGGSQSKHAQGYAIDLNPKINPWVGEDGGTSPKNAKKYSDRTQKDWTAVEKSAAISRKSKVYRIFTEKGWQWGGDWKGDKDYRHFYK